MHYMYKTQNTCSSFIEFDIENNKIINVKYTGGCNGNLKAISILVDNCNIDDVIDKLKGIDCKGKKTSCADQLACALIDIKKQTANV